MGNQDFIKNETTAYPVDIAFSQWFELPAEYWDILFKPYNSSDEISCHLWLGDGDLANTHKYTWGGLHSTMVVYANDTNAYIANVNQTNYYPSPITQSVTISGYFDEFDSISFINSDTNDVISEFPIVEGSDGYFTLTTTAIPATNFTVAFKPKVSTFAYFRGIEGSYVRNEEYFAPTEREVNLSGDFEKAELTVRNVDGGYLEISQMQISYEEEDE